MNRTSKQTRWHGHFSYVQLHKPAKHVTQGPERKDTERFSRIYPPNLGLTAYKSETDFPNYIFNKLTLFELCEELRGI